MCYIKVVSRWFMCYINQDLLVTKVNNYKFLTNLKVSPIEITLGKKKCWLGLYRPLSYSENEFLLHLENALSHYTTYLLPTKISP